MRPIDADALEARMYHDAFEVDSDMQRWDSGCWIRYKMFENAIREAPTIEERKKGKWIKKDCDLLYCSECDLPSLHPWPYCERCGADMGGEKMRLIDADALSKKLLEELHNRSMQGFGKGLMIANSCVVNAPTIEPKKGKWIPSVDKWGDIVTTVDGYTCSDCGSFNADKDNFCPYCGADMRGDKHETD